MSALLRLGASTKVARWRAVAVVLTTNVFIVLWVGLVPLAVALCTYILRDTLTLPDPKLYRANIGSSPCKSRVAATLVWLIVLTSRSDARETRRWVMTLRSNVSVLSMFRMRVLNNVSALTVMLRVSWRASAVQVPCPSVN